VFYTDTNGMKPRFRITALVLLEMVMEHSLYDIAFEMYNEAVTEADEFLPGDEI
jgi:hypothetical protein